MELKDLENEIENIKQRNLYVRNYDNIFLSSLVPVIGFISSTLLLRYIRKIWEKNTKNDK